HFFAGVAALAVFVHTGYVLRTGFPALHGGNDAVRYQYRASHIYLLLAGLLHVVAALYVTRFPSRGARAAQAVGSAMLVAATALLAYAFYGEPKGIPGRPL